MSASQKITLTVQGTIDKCVTGATTDMYCKFGFSCGSDWEAFAGSKAGITHSARTSLHQEATFNYPIGISLSSQTPFGWPQIVITVYGYNNFGNDMIIGYGAVHLPTQSGKTELTVPLFAPEASGFFQKLSAWFTGLYPELIDSNMVAQSQDREVMRTHSQGYIKLTLNTVLSNLEPLQYKT